jgi:CRISPR-associated protein Csd1
MLLAALYELSVRENLVPDEGYVLGRCDYALRISPRGKLLSLTEDKKKLLIPQSEVRTSGTSPGFFVDNTKYVFGLGGVCRPEKDKEAKRRARLSEALKAYYQQVRSVFESTNDPGAEAYARFLFGMLSRQWEKKLIDLGPEKDREKHPDGWSGADVIVCYLENEAEPIFSRPAIREAWATIRLASDPGRVGRCLITGKMAPVKMVHPKIKGIPGAQASGASLCCFDKEAFEGRGAVQGENACISREGAEGYAAALNWLLERTETRQHRWGVRVGESATMVVWTAIQSEFAGDLLETLSPDPAKVLEYPTAIYRGMAPSPIDEAQFFAATLSPNASRVVVRDFIAESVGAIKRNVLKHFEDMKIGVNPGRISLWSIQGALNRQTASDKRKGGAYIASAYGAALMQAILRGTQYPRDLLSLVITRLYDPSIQGRTLEVCCSILKAVLLRLPPGQDKEVSVALDENNSSVAYLLGRLFATMERLQQIALPEVGASIRDRHFSSAFTMPAQVYPSLLGLSSHHYTKTENVRNGRGRWVERVKSQIMAMLPAEPFPAQLSQENQALWLVGYYHQRDDFWKKKVSPTSPQETEAVTEQ